MVKRKKTQPTSRSRSRPKKKPVVTIIGAGRVGSAFGIALRDAGYQIDLVVAKHGQTAKRSARLIGKSAIGLSAAKFRGLSRGQRDRLSRSSLILLTIPDDVVESAARALATALHSFPATVKPSRAPRVVLHTSGALSSEVLRPLKGEGFATGSLHPLISISEPRSGARSLANAFCSVEGDAAAIRLGKQIVRDLGGKSFTIKSDVKALYHAAALTASPNMTALFDIALEMLSRCGLTQTRARHILLPLVRSTLDNLVTHAPSRALTGTFKRGDITTVRKHLAAIEAHDLPDALQAYILLGQRSLLLSDRPPNEKQIRRLLTGALKRQRRQP